MIKGTLYLKENPGWRNGFTKDCFYNYHNKTYLEDILRQENYSFKWSKYEKSNDTCLLLIEKL